MWVGFTIKFNSKDNTYILVPESKSVDKINFSNSKKSFYKIEESGTYKVEKAATL